MKQLLLVGFVSACALAAQPKPGTGSVEGHVFNSLSSAPVRKATVILTAPQIRLVAGTDAEGRFQFSALPPGTYRLSASHSGFLDHPTRRPISLGPNDHVTSAEIRLPPLSVIAGHVLDEGGEPVGGAVVWIFKQVYGDGRRQWDRVNSETASFTSETGEYRLPNLRPGRYILRAYDPNPRPPVDNRYGEPDLPARPHMVRIPAYYPNAPSEQAALPVEVGVGAEVPSIDIRLLKVDQPPLVHVHGKVVGLPPDAQSVISVGGIRKGGGPFGWRGGTAKPPDYAFDLEAAPGEYTIVGHVYYGGLEAYGTGSITITGDVAGVVLAMSPPRAITGRINLAESGSGVNLQGVVVTLNDLDYHLSWQEGESDATGKLVFAKRLPPGHYTLKVRSIPDGCFVREVKLGGQEVSPDDFEIPASTQLELLELVLSSTAGRIGGSVSDADGKPFPNSSVTLIPTDGKSRPVKQSVDDDGNFRFTGLRPGKYKLFAWEEVDDDLWQDPEFWKRYESRATEVTVGPSETQNARVRVIAAEDMK